MDWIAPSVVTLLFGLFLYWRWRNEPRMSPLPLTWSLVAEVVFIGLAAYPSIALFGLTLMGQGHAIGRGVEPWACWWPYFMASFPVVLALGLTFLLEARRHWPLLASLAVILAPLEQDAFFWLFTGGGIWFTGGFGMLTLGF
jgi:hypothetical protein